MAFERILDELGQPGRGGAVSGDGAPVMLTFGPIAFSVSAAAFQQFQRSTRYRWPAHERVGVRPVYQYTGPGEESIAISGAIFPTYRGRPSALEELRSLAGEGKPRLLTAGTGESFGRWFIDSVDEERSFLFADGAPRKVTYTLKLRRDDDAPSGRQDGLESAARRVGDVRTVIDAFT